MTFADLIDAVVFLVVLSLVAAVTESMAAELKEG